MEKMKPVNGLDQCPACGAPITSEICPYCGMKTGLDTASADMEYPVIECKATTLNFWTVWFPTIFAVAFGIPGIAVFVAGIVTGEGFLIPMGLLFFLIGAVAAFLTIRALLRYGKVKKNGKEMTATVYGYMDDNVLINGRPAQIVKLLVQTPNGPRFILYKLGNTLKPYGVNDTLDIMVYENCFMICKNKEKINW